MTKAKRKGRNISVCNIKSSKYMEDPKLNQIPVVNLERCNFEDFLNADVKNDKKERTNRKRHNSKVDSTVQHKNARKHRGLEYFDELENRSHKLIQNPQSNKKIFRERKKVDYKEKLSIGTPEIEPKPADGIRVPIYKQFNSSQISSNNAKHDQYAFIPDSDEDKGSDISFHIETPAKKRRIMKMLHIPRRRVRNVNNKENNPTKPETYKNKIENIMHSVKKKINTTNNTNVNTKAQINVNAFEKKNHLVVKNMKNSIINMNLIFNSTPGRETSNISLPNESRILFNKYRSKSNENVQTQQDLKETLVKVATSNVQSISSHKKSLISHDQGYLKGNDINLHKNKSVDENVEPPKSNVCAIEESNALSGYSSPASNFAFDNENNVENLFGFIEDIEEENKQKTPVKNKINIIQNIELTKSITSNHRIQQSKRISWRFNDSITRNPHFVQLKNNGLPYVSQDPVLDHTFEDRLSEVITTKSVPLSRKPLKQKSILNFVETNKEYSNENLSTPSLFNVEDYCPIKVNPLDKENFNSNRIPVIKPTTRRNVLAEINENIMAGKTSTPAKSQKFSEPMQIDVSLIEHEKDDDIFNNFGFNSWSESEENEKVEGVIESRAKPFRLAINFEQKRQRKKLTEKLLQPVRDSEVRKIVKVGEDPEFSKLIENEGLECEKVGLFEDADTSQNITKCYKAKTKKKIVSTKDNPKKRDNECKLSREAKKWIKEFNQMCDEVENEELETN
ncbi:hypothetical protein WA026_007782 [Henosepilachna vigintioctopunctata]|uniref:Uncharacterized protein n=1 Tax=Henosepilachna vigintioctopunctata TaxID=420089 RepID=A0AAW1TXD2_9CUCU